MREIKFRAWDSKLNMWIYGVDNFIYTDGSAKLNLAAFFRRILNDTFDVTTKGQFTGIVDINGDDIYEGDILHHLDPVSFSPLTVEFKAPRGSYYIRSEQLMKSTVNQLELAIIGNIHQNPELLK